MNKLQKKVLSVLASTSMVFSLVTPVMADTITISENGSGSGNVAAVTQVNTTTVSQTNTAVVDNHVTTSATTGDNTASKNTAGDVTVGTGDSLTQVSIENTLNSNEASKTCCETSDLNVLIAGNGASDDHDKSPDNSVLVTNANTTTLVQTNEAEVDNSVKTGSTTGDNDTGKNTGGAVTVATGDADSHVGIVNDLNSNTAKIGSVLPSHGDATVGIVENGSGSENGVSLSLINTTVVGQTNSAEVDNNVKSSLNTGDNDGDKNTNGSVWIGTGDATSVVGIETQANFNWADVNCCGTYDVSALIKKNGADSKNTMALDFINTKESVQTNTGEVDNEVFSKANTGDNDADRNTGGHVRILTGDAEEVLGIDNMLNFNHASLDCCVSGLEAAIEKNGTDTKNGIIYDAINTAGTFQVNDAALDNMVGSHCADGVSTGDNTADNNTGDPSSDPAILTGDAVSMTHIANSANMNEVGGHTLPMPDFDFDFDFSLEWVHQLLLLVNW